MEWIAVIYSKLKLFSVIIFRLLDRSFSLSNPKEQYFIGLVLNFAFLLIVYSSEKGYSNLQVPVGQYKENIWNQTDVISYFQPALNYSEYGVFGVKNTPDHFRTVGYPFLLYVFYSIFGSHWLLYLLAFQCLLYALIYPLTTALVKLFYPETDKKIIAYIFIFSCLSGTYFTRSLMVMTDMLFVVLFYFTIYCNILMYRKRSTLFSIAMFFSLLVSALVRPTLALYPVLNICLAYFVFGKREFISRKNLPKVVISTIACLIVVNVSTVRNYINYHFLSPSSVIGVNAFEYMTKKILYLTDNEKLYEQYKFSIDNVSDINKKNKLQKRYMLQSIKSFPLATCKILIKNSINFFFDVPVINNTSIYFGFYWKQTNETKSTCLPDKKLFIANYIGMAFYAILFAGFISFIIRICTQKRYEFIFIIALIAIMFVATGIMTGDGGSRFRLPFELIYFSFSVVEISYILSAIKITYRKRNIIPELVRIYLPIKNRGVQA